MSIEATRRAWVEVDPAALGRNGRTLVARLRPGCRLLPMIKADGYGLGAERAMRALEPLDPWGFGVATVEEGVALRRSGWLGRVIVFTPCAPMDAAAMVRERLEPVVTEIAALKVYGEAAAATARTLSLHLEIDTGMGRSGPAWNRAGSWARELRAALAELPLELASTFTHFHSAAEDEDATREQWRRYRDALVELKRAGIERVPSHACNSAAILRFSEMHADVVRPGIFLYGGRCGGARPEPVAAVRARVLCVSRAGEGTTVSYGATYRTPGPARLATLAIGYADGLRRELSNRGYAILRGRRAPIRGDVCMDSIVVDVTGIDGVRSGDVATILGRDGAEEIGLEEMARWCETIDYEILTGWSSRLPRIEAPVGENGTASADEGRGSSGVPRG
ncbi:MAG: alanine racemase [Gemmatimonadota bacterium]